MQVSRQSGIDIKAEQYDSFLLTWINFNRSMDK